MLSTSPNEADFPGSKTAVEGAIGSDSLQSVKKSLQIWAFVVCRVLGVLGEAASRELVSLENATRLSSPLG